MKISRRVSWLIVVSLLGILILYTPTLRADESATPAAAPDNGKPHKVWTTTVRLKAKVADIDYAKRTVSLEGPDGNIVTLNVDPSVKRFEETKKGDMISVDYLESMAVRVQSPGEPIVNETGSYMVSAHGKKPAGTVVQTTTITATVEKINYKTREVVLKNQDGQTQTLLLGPEVKKFDQIKQGDHVIMNATAAVAIAVTKG